MNGLSFFDVRVGVLIVLTEVVKIAVNSVLWVCIATVTRVPSFEGFGVVISACPAVMDRINELNGR